MKEAVHQCHFVGLSDILSLKISAEIQTRQSTAVQVRRLTFFRFITSLDNEKPTADQVKSSNLTCELRLIALEKSQNKSKEYQSQKKPDPDDS